MMKGTIGGVFLVGGFLWFAIVPFSGIEPTMCQIIGAASLLIAGAILVNKR